MKKVSKRILAVMLAAVTFIFSGATALADAETDKPYVALGADLTADERAKVLKELDITEADLKNYTVVKVTNAEEHQYLDSYLSKSVIGTRALSSVIITKKKSGNGLQVTTKNISYCTVGMYQNALITAGIEDADIIVAGPMSITGTAGLVGIIKSYETMTGEALPEESVDAAMDELVTTGEIADSVGDTDKVEELVAIVKQDIIENDLQTEEEIMGAIDNAADQLEVTLSQADKDKIAALMDKIKDLDIDVDALKNQAKNIYDKIKDVDLTEAGNWFSNLFKSIGDFFKNLFS